MKILPSDSPAPASAAPTQPTPPVAKPGQVNPDGTFNIVHEHDYILVVRGIAAVVIREALDKAGAALGQDKGQIFWQVRGDINAQLQNPTFIEGLAGGLIAQRAAAGTAKEDPAKTVADRLAKKATKR